MVILIVVITITIVIIISIITINSIFMNNYEYYTKKKRDINILNKNNDNNFYKNKFFKV